MNFTDTEYASPRSGHTGLLQYVMPESVSSITQPQEQNVCRNTLKLPLVELGKGFRCVMVFPVGFGSGEVFFTPILWGHGSGHNRTTLLP